MLTLNDIINIGFHKSQIRGYNTEEVDAFVDQVKESYEALIKKTIEQKEENEKKEEEKQQLSKKLDLLAARIEEYRQEESEIKNALVSAQKLGDASIREARHKAEIIIKDANMKAERIVSGSKTDLTAQQNELERLRKTTSEFRSRLLEQYKQHLTLINALPTSRAELKEKTDPKKQTEFAVTEDPEEPDILTRAEPVILSAPPERSAVLPKHEAPAKISDTDLELPDDFQFSVSNFDESSGENPEFGDMHLEIDGFNVKNEDAEHFF